MNSLQSLCHIIDKSNNDDEDLDILIEMHASSPEKNIIRPRSFSDCSFVVKKNCLSLQFFVYDGCMM